MSNIDSFVDKVYVINMKKDRERLQEITKKCSKNNIVFERFEGINPSSLDKDLYNKNTSLFSKYFI